MGNSASACPGVVPLLEELPDPGGVLGPDAADMDESPGAQAVGQDVAAPVVDASVVQGRDSLPVLRLKDGTVGISASCFKRSMLMFSPSQWCGTMRVTSDSLSTICSPSVGV